MAKVSFEPVYTVQAAILEFGSVRKAASALNISKSSLHNISQGKGWSGSTYNKLYNAYFQLPADQKRNIDGGVRILRNVVPEDTRKLLSKPKENAAALRIYKGLIEKHKKRRRLDKKLLKQLTGSFGY